MDTDRTTSQPHDDEDSLPCVTKFNPPVSQQRYQTMINIVKKYQSKKVLDMGCGECALFRQLKHESSIEQLTGVDQDGDLLQANRYLAKPLLCEYLHPRSRPFTVSLYEGSIGEKDARMVGYDLMLCVEIIEHLYPDTLAAMPDTVFGFMRPRVIVFTTPNADFNILFPNMQGFRHWDHKFEWSREEFQSWGDRVASDYGYSVTYEGIGPGPPGTEHLGCCTQMAVFTCSIPPHEGSTQVDDCSTPYNLVCEVSHPHRKITMTTEEQILTEATYYLQRLSHSMKQCYTDDEDVGSVGCGDIIGSRDEETRGGPDEGKRKMSISLETMMKFSCLRKVCPSVEKLRDVLASSDSVTMSQDGTSIIYSVEEENTSETGNSSDEISIDETEAVGGESASYENDGSWRQEMDREELWD